MNFHSEKDNIVLNGEFCSVEKFLKVLDGSFDPPSHPGSNEGKSTKLLEVGLTKDGKKVTKDTATQTQMNNFRYWKKGWMVGLACRL